VGTTEFGEIIGLAPLSVLRRPSYLSFQNAALSVNIRIASFNKPNGRLAMKERLCPAQL
jgi:hypothetical protein